MYLILIHIKGSLQYLEAQEVCWHQGGPSHCAMHWNQEAGGLSL